MTNVKTSLQGEWPIQSKYRSMVVTLLPRDPLSYMTYLCSKQTVVRFDRLLQATFSFSRNKIEQILFYCVLRTTQAYGLNARNNVVRNIVAQQCCAV